MKNRMGLAQQYAKGPARSMQGLGVHGNATCAEVAATLSCLLSFAHCSNRVVQRPSCIPVMVRSQVHYLVPHRLRLWPALYSTNHAKGPDQVPAIGIGGLQPHPAGGIPPDSRAKGAPASAALKGARPVRCSGPLTHYDCLPAARERLAKQLTVAQPSRAEVQAAKWKPKKSK